MRGNTRLKVRKRALAQRFNLRAMPGAGMWLRADRGERTCLSGVERNENAVLGNLYGFGVARVPLAEILFTSNQIAAPPLGGDFSGSLLSGM